MRGSAGLGVQLCTGYGEHPLAGCRSAHSLRVRRRLLQSLPSNVTNVAEAREQQQQQQQQQQPQRCRSVFQGVLYQGRELP